MSSVRTALYMLATYVSILWILMYLQGPAGPILYILGIIPWGAGFARLVGVRAIPPLWLQYILASLTWGLPAFVIFIAAGGKPLEEEHGRRDTHRKARFGYGLVHR